MEPLPAADAGTVLRIVATNDMGAAFVGVPTSWGRSGTCAGIAELIERERERRPTVWLDAGDLTVGAAQPLAGEARWDDVARLPIAAAAVGNHELDEGLPALRRAAARLPFPLLCANADLGLPASAVVETAAGPLGVIGLTHPDVHRHVEAPAPHEGRPERIAGLARELRAGGARWVVALLHDGATWWPHEAGIGTRAERLHRLAAPWAGAVDVVLGGHTLGAWTGELAGTPAGHAYPFASTVLVADLAAPPRPAAIRGVVPVPAVRPADASPAMRALDAAAGRVVAESAVNWLSRTGAPHYLPGLVAEAMRRATGADAGLAPGGQCANQAPLDGAVAAVRAGPVTELDLWRLFNYADDELVVAALRPGELRAAVAAHDATVAPDARPGDDVWWAWCRMPARASAEGDEPRTVAVVPWVAPRLAEWLGREVETERAGVGAREALRRALS